MKKKIFISYSNADKHLANDIAANLVKEGFFPFLDAQMQLSEDWSERIINEINNSSFFVPFISDAYLQSNFPLIELGAALAADKQIIPVLMNSVKLPLNFSKYHIVDGNKLSQSEVKAEVLKAIAA